jgi:hypothetical protein
MAWAPPQTTAPYGRLAATPRASWAWRLPPTPPSRRFPLACTSMLRCLPDGLWWASLRGCTTRFCWQRQRGRRWLQRQVTSQRARQERQRQVIAVAMGVEAPSRKRVQVLRTLGVGKRATGPTTSARTAGRLRRRAADRCRRRRARCCSAAAPTRVCSWRGTCSTRPRWTLGLLGSPARRPAAAAAGPGEAAAASGAAAVEGRARRTGALGGRWIE